jgi:Flp pilus assembly protein TadD
MRTRTIIAIFVALIVTIAATAMWSAATVERDGDTDANVIDDSGSEVGTVSEPSNKKGNKVVRLVAAPFKALGKLFGHKHEQKLARLTEKDAEKFASVGVERVDDSLSPKQKETVAGSARDHLVAGRQLLKEGRINEAIGELSTAVSLDGKLAEAHSLLGLAFDRKGLGDRAKDSYEKAAKIEPEDPQTLNNLGFSLYQNGNYRAAIDRLKRAAKLAPTDERILNNLGLALCRLGKFDEAYRYFARAGGEQTGRINVATMLERLGRDAEAIKYYEAAQRFDSKNAIASGRLTALYQRTGRGAPVPAVAGTIAEEAAARR